MENAEFLGEFERFYDAFKKELDDKQALQYFNRLKSISIEQFRDVVTTALDELSKFPTLADLVKICRAKNYFEKRIEYSDKDRFVHFVCYCKTSVALERKKIQDGIGSFMCPGTKYQKPVPVGKEMMEAEKLLAARRRYASTLPAAHRDREADEARKQYEATKNDLKNRIRSAPMMCDRSYDYLFIKQKCKIDQYGEIDMEKQKIKEDDPYLFEVPTGGAR